MDSDPAGILFWFLVVRLVHGEAPTGNRQYWITRPVEWQKLLAAKILFVAAFVNFPLLIVDVFLLAKAGFRPEASYTAGLLWRQVIWAAFLLLPVATLAAVTSNVAQMMMAVLAVGILMAGMVSLTSYLPNSAPSDVPDYLQAAVLGRMLRRGNPAIRTPQDQSITLHSGRRGCADLFDCACHTVFSPGIV